MAQSNKDHEDDVERRQDQESDLIGLDTPFNEDIKEWLALHNIENLSPTVYLYRLPASNMYNMKQRALVGKFSDRIPDDHEIGMTYGAGKYEMIILIPKGDKQPKGMNSRKIHIDAYYEELRRQEAIKNNPSGQIPMTPQVIIPPQNNNADVLAMFEKVIGLLMPFISQAFAQKENPAASMMQSYVMMNKIMQNQALETQNLLTDMTRKNMNLPQPPAQDESEGTVVEQPKGFLDSIIGLLNSPVIANVLGLLTKNDAQAKLTAATVKTIPEVKQILVDPLKLRESIRYLDVKLGYNETNTILKNLKVARPHDMIKPIPGVMRPSVKKPIQSQPTRKNLPVSTTNKMVNGAMKVETKK
jgi:hypothetical protein